MAKARTCVLVAGARMAAVVVVGVVVAVVVGVVVSVVVAVVVVVAYKEEGHAALPRRASCLRWL